MKKGNPASGLPFFSSCKSERYRRLIPRSLTQACLSMVEPKGNNDGQNACAAPSNEAPLSISGS
jgi:hypothetical protein